MAGGGHFLGLWRHGGIGDLDRCDSAARNLPSRDSFQSIYTKLSSPAAFQQFKDALTGDPRLNVKVMRQTEYYSEQSTAVTRLINTLGVLIARLMAGGASFGALNTIYSAVSARTREIATLHALGFGRGSVVVSVMLESRLPTFQRLSAPSD